MSSPNTHEEFVQLKIGGEQSHAFVTGVPDKCDHDYSIVVWVLSNGDILREPDYRCPTDEETAKYIQHEAEKRNARISEGSSQCSKCGKIYYPDLFI